MAQPITLAGDALFDGITSARVKAKRVSVSLAASGDLVAAVTGKAIRVVAYSLSAAGAVTVKFQSNATTDLTGTMSLVTGTPLPGLWNLNGHFQTNSGEKLNLVLGGAVQISGWLTYCEV
jgi:hypothetical protein